MKLLLGVPSQQLDHSRQTVGVLKWKRCYILLGFFRLGIEEQGGRNVSNERYFVHFKIDRLLRVDPTSLITRTVCSAVVSAGRLRDGCLVTLLEVLARASWLCITLLGIDLAYDSSNMRAVSRNVTTDEGKWKRPCQQTQRRFY